MLTRVNFNVNPSEYGSEALCATLVAIGDFPDYHGVNDHMSNQYSGTTKLLGVPYKRKSVSQVTDANGDTCCPKCGRVDKLVFVDEHVQSGFYYNKYMEFMLCTHCDTHTCVVMVRKDDRHD